MDFADILILANFPLQCPSTVGPRTPTAHDAGGGSVLVVCSVHPDQFTSGIVASLPLHSGGLGIRSAALDSIGPVGPMLWP